MTDPLPPDQAVILLTRIHTSLTQLFYDYFAFDENADLCTNDYSILLSQTLSSLISLQQKYSNSDEKMFELITISLDSIR